MDAVALSNAVPENAVRLAFIREIIAYTLAFRSL
jgi:hypothetical protein